MRKHLQHAIPELLLAIRQQRPESTAAKILSSNKLSRVGIQPEFRSTTIFFDSARIPVLWELQVSLNP